MKKKYKRSFKLAFCSKRNDKIGIKYTFEGSEVRCSIYDEYAYNVILSFLKTIDSSFMLPKSTKVQVYKNCVIFTAVSKCHKDDQYTIEEGTLFAKQKALEIRENFYGKYVGQAAASIRQTWWKSTTKLEHSLVEVID